ncbi:MAG: cysteine peptidase family C39 domain-containing protein, partial [Candidatus Omnitrophica bacterium]|nr:cysteine peptidase family C39 domain-containing protein [Candidatus Omnitrophota bacterium]
MDKLQKQTEGQFEQPETKPEFKSSFKAWIRVVAFIVVAVFLPEQVAQAVEYDWRILWNKPVTGSIAPSYLKDLSGIDTALAIRNILKDIANKPITAIKISSNLTIGLDKPLEMSNQKIDEIFQWLKGRPCGSKALYDYLNYTGLKVTEQDIAILALTIDILNDVVKPEGNPEVIKTSLYALSKTSEFFGQRLYSVKLDLNNLDKKIDLTPFIAHVNGDHYVLVTHISQDKVYFSDNHTEEFLPKEKFLNEFTGYALISKPMSVDLEISVSQAKAVLGSGRNPGRYSNSVNWSKWSKNMTTSILVNLGMNMVSSSLSGGWKNIPSKLYDNFGSSIVSGVKSMAVSYAVQSYVQGVAMENNWSSDKAALVGSALGGFAAGLTTSIGAMSGKPSLKLSNWTGGALGNAFLGGVTTAISQATATRVYLSLYDKNDTRTNATAQIGSLAAGLLMMQASKSLVPGAFGIDSSSLTKSKAPFNLGDFWKNNRTTIFSGVGGAALGAALYSNNRVAGALIGAGVGAGAGYLVSNRAVVLDTIKNNAMPMLIGGVAGAAMGAFTGSDGSERAISALAGFGLGATSGLLIKKYDFSVMGGVSGALAGYMYGGDETKDRLRSAALGFVGGTAVGAFVNIIDDMEKRPYMEKGLKSHLTEAGKTSPDGKEFLGYAEGSDKLKEYANREYKFEQGTSYGDIMKYITVKSGAILLEEGFRSMKYDKVKKEGESRGLKDTDLDDYIGDEMGKYEIYYSGLGAGYEILGTTSYSSKDKWYTMLGQGLLQGGVSVGVAMLRNKLVNNYGIDPVTASNATMWVSAAGRALTDTLIHGDSFYYNSDEKTGELKERPGFGGYIQQGTNKALNFGWGAKDKMSDVITYNNYVTQIVNFGQRAANSANGGFAVVYGQHLADSFHYSTVENSLGLINNSYIVAKIITGQAYERVRGNMSELASGAKSDTEVDFTLKLKLFGKKIFEDGELLSKAPQQENLKTKIDGIVFNKDEGYRLITNIDKPGEGIYYYETQRESNSSPLPEKNRALTNTDVYAISVPIPGIEDKAYGKLYKGVFEVDYLGQDSNGRASFLGLAGAPGSKVTLDLNTAVLSPALTAKIQPLIAGNHEGKITITTTRDNNITLSFGKAGADNKLVAENTATISRAELAEFKQALAPWRDYRGAGFSEIVAQDKKVSHVNSPTGFLTNGLMVNSSPLELNNVKINGTLSHQIESAKIEMWQSLDNSNKWNIHPLTNLLTVATISGGVSLLPEKADSLYFYKQADRSRFGILLNVQNGIGVNSFFSAANSQEAKVNKPNILDYKYNFFGEGAQSSLFGFNGLTQKSPFGYFAYNYQDSIKVKDELDLLAKEKEPAETPISGELTSTFIQTNGSFDKQTETFKVDNAMIMPGSTLQIELGQDQDGKWRATSLHEADKAKFSNFLTAQLPAKFEKAVKENKLTNYIVEIQRIKPGEYNVNFFKNSADREAIRQIGTNSPLVMKIDEADLNDLVKAGVPIGDNLLFNVQGTINYKRNNEGNYVSDIIYQQKNLEQPALVMPTKATSIEAKAAGVSGGEGVVNVKLFTFNQITYNAEKNSNTFSLYPLALLQGEGTLSSTYLNNMNKTPIDSVFFNIKSPSLAPEMGVIARVTRGTDDTIFHNRNLAPTPTSSGAATSTTQANESAIPTRAPLTDLNVIKTHSDAVIELGKGTNLQMLLGVTEINGVQVWQAQSMAGFIGNTITLQKDTSVVWGETLSYKGKEKDVFATFHIGEEKRDGKLVPIIDRVTSKINFERKDIAIGDKDVTLLGTLQQGKNRKVEQKFEKIKFGDREYGIKMQVNDGFLIKGAQSKFYIIGKGFQNEAKITTEDGRTFTLKAGKSAGISVFDETGKKQVGALTDKGIVFFEIDKIRASMQELAGFFEKSEASGADFDKARNIFGRARKAFNEGDYVNAIDALNKASKEATRQQNKNLMEQLRTQNLIPAGYSLDKDAQNGYKQLAAIVEEYKKNGGPSTVREQVKERLRRDISVLENEQRSLVASSADKTEVDLAARKIAKAKEALGLLESSDPQKTTQLTRRVKDLESAFVSQETKWRNELARNGDMPDQGIWAGIWGAVAVNRDDSIREERDRRAVDLTYARVALIGLTATGAKDLYDLASKINSELKMEDRGTARRHETEMSAVKVDANALSLIMNKKAVVEETFLIKDVGYVTRGYDEKGNPYEVLTELAALKYDGGRYAPKYAVKVIDLESGGHITIKQEAFGRTRVYNDQGGEIMGNVVAKTTQVKENDNVIGNMQKVVTPSGEIKFIFQSKDSSIGTQTVAAKEVIFEQSQVDRMSFNLPNGKELFVAADGKVMNGFEEYNAKNYEAADDVQENTYFRYGNRDMYSGVTFGHFSNSSDLKRDLEIALRSTGTGQISQDRLANVFGDAIETKYISRVNSLAVQAGLNTMDSSSPEYAAVYKRIQRIALGELYREPAVREYMSKTNLAPVAFVDDAITWGSTAKVGGGVGLVVGGTVVAVTGVGSAPGGGMAAAGLTTLGIVGSAAAITTGNALIYNGITGQNISSNILLGDFAVNLVTAGLASWAKVITVGTVAANATRAEI